MLKAYHPALPGVVALGRDMRGVSESSNGCGSVALRFGERVLDLCNGFFRPIEIDSRGKTLLK